MTNFLHKASGTLGSGAFWSFGLRSTGSVSEATAQGAWDGAINGFFADASVAALYPTGMELTSTTTSTASSTWRQTTKTPNTHTTAGTAVSQELPDYCAMVITLRSANATKSGHGRMYLPAPVAAALAVGTGGHLSAASVATLTGALTTAFNTIGLGGLTPVIMTPKATLGGLPPYNTQAITERELVHTLGVQTRRGDKLVPARTTF